MTDSKELIERLRDCAQEAGRISQDPLVAPEDRSGFVIFEQAFADAAKEISELREALNEAWLAMNYMGDHLNGIDVVEPLDEEIVSPAFDKIIQAMPEVESIDAYAVLGARHHSPVGNCARCNREINWHEPRELLKNDAIACVPKCKFEGNGA